MKKICMILYSSYITDARVKREAETLASIGHKVTILTLKSKEFPQTLQNRGVQIIELNVKKYIGKNKFVLIMSYMKFLLLSFIACTILTFKRQIDVVHVHNMPDFLILAAIVPKLIGKRIILDIHDTVPETYLSKFRNSPQILSKLLNFEEQICASLANKIICVNHIQKEVIMNRGIPSNKITLSMNVPDTKFFNLKKKEFIIKKKGGGFNIVYHGTLDKSLGIDLAVRAISLLVEKIHGIKFNIIGYGKDKDEFNQLITELNMEQYISINENIFSVEELPKVLIKMDIGIIPNRKNIATELMLPVKLLEYISMGIPVVVPRLKTIEYYFSDDMVKYYEPENIDSMASGILELCMNKEKRKQQVEQAFTFLDQYGWDKHKINLINLYENI